MVRRLLVKGAGVALLALLVTEGATGRAARAGSDCIAIGRHRGRTRQEGVCRPDGANRDLLGVQTSALERSGQLWSVRIHSFGGDRVSDGENRRHTLPAQVDADAILTTLRMIEAQEHGRQRTLGCGLARIQCMQYAVDHVGVAGGFR